MWAWRFIQSDEGSVELKDDWVEGYWDLDSTRSLLYSIKLKQIKDLVGSVDFLNFTSLEIMKWFIILTDSLLPSQHTTLLFS